jgi:hypothetical protein
MKNGNSLYLMLVGLLCVLVIGIWVGCESQPTSPTEIVGMDKKSVNDLDGIRVNGTESDADHHPTQTFEAWFRGTKLQGPSPLGNYWTDTDAMAAWKAAGQGSK